MHTTKGSFTAQRGWVFGLALLSLALPLAAGILRNEPATPLADPAHLSYYRQTVIALVLGLVSAIATFVGSRATAPARLRQVSVILASLGLLIGAYLLLALVGSCGAGIILGVCQP